MLLLWLSHNYKNFYNHIATTETTSDVVHGPWYYYNYHHYYHVYNYYSYKRTQQQYIYQCTSGGLVGWLHQTRSTSHSIYYYYYYYNACNYYSYKRTQQQYIYQCTSGGLVGWLHQTRSTWHSIYYYYYYYYYYYSPLSFFSNASQVLGPVLGLESQSLGPVLGLEGQVLGLESQSLGPVLELSNIVNITAYCERDTLATDMQCFTVKAECYHWYS